MPALLTAYTKLVAARAARPVVYRVDEIEVRINQVLQCRSNGSVMHRELVMWLDEMKGKHADDVTEDKMKEGWET